MEISLALFSHSLIYGVGKLGPFLDFLHYQVLTIIMLHYQVLTNLMLCY